MSRQVRATSAPSPSDDIPAVLIEAIVLTVTGLSRALWWVLVQFLRMPALALLLLVGVAVWLRCGAVVLGLSAGAAASAWSGGGLAHRSRFAVSSGCRWSLWLGRRNIGRGGLELLDALASSSMSGQQTEP